MQAVAAAVHIITARLDLVALAVVRLEPETIQRLPMQRLTLVAVVAVVEQ
jgi:hypothetical protein